MPRNLGAAPDYSGPIDLRLRNGRIIRSTTADKWRWKPWDWGISDWDIESWQKSGEVK